MSETHRGGCVPGALPRENGDAAPSARPAG